MTSIDFVSTNFLVSLVPSDERKMFRDFLCDQKMSPQEFIKGFAEPGDTANQAIERARMYMHDGMDGKLEAAHNAFARIAINDDSTNNSVCHGWYDHLPQTESTVDRENHPSSSSSIPQEAVVPETSEDPIMPPTSQPRPELLWYPRGHPLARQTIARQVVSIQENDSGNPYQASAVSPNVPNESSSASVAQGRALPAQYAQTAAYPSITRQSAGTQENVASNYNYYHTEDMMPTQGQQVPYGVQLSGLVNTGPILRPVSYHVPHHSQEINPNEPDVDGNFAKWEAWALRLLLEDFFNVSRETIEKFISVEYAAASERKEARSRERQAARAPQAIPSTPDYNRGRREALERGNNEFRFP